MHPVGRRGSTRYASLYPGLELGIWVDADDLAKQMLSQLQVSVGLSSATASLDGTSTNTYRGLPHHALPSTKAHPVKAGAAKPRMLDSSSQPQRCPEGLGPAELP